MGSPHDVPNDRPEITRRRLIPWPRTVETTEERPAITTAPPRLEIETGPLRGLSDAEVAAHRERGEVNTVEFTTTRSYKRILRENAFTFINTLLFAIVIALLILGLTGDALLTASIVLLNVIAGVIQEGRAKRQLDRIALLMRPSATAIRNGQPQTISPSEIVTDDLLVVRAGDQILVDGVIIEGSRVEADESLLTGESEPVVKQVGDTIYSGTYCVTGEAVFRAQHVGAGSMAQRITASARQFRQEKTPLQQDIGRVIQATAVMMVILAILVLNAFREIYHGLPLIETVQAGAVIVALVPQGLILMVTTSYAMAALRMAGKGALIQRMGSVEAMSHLDVLCLDKTGTLTTNRLRLETALPAGTSYAELARTLGDFAASTPSANRTSEAIRDGLGGERRALRRSVPFSSAYKWSGLAFAGQPGFYILGAPEVLEPRLRPGSTVPPELHQWTEQGLRVLLFASFPDNVNTVDGAAVTRPPELPEGLTLLGAVSLRDELRPEAEATIREFTDAGIRLKIISGDHPETVSALARQAGIPGSEHAISGAHLADLNDLELQEIAAGATVFGRVTPQQKERLVGALRDTGHFVGMIGDGVNDIPALKRSQLAISLRSGSQATRNVADLVLLNDSFAALPRAFLEGQRVINGMTDILQLFLVRTLYIALIIVGAALLDVGFPITPKNNALLALLTVGVPALALAVWAKPGPSRRDLLAAAVHFVVPAVVTITTVGLAVYIFFLSATDDLELARSALTMTTILCGLLLIPFVEPPTNAWVGGDTLADDWKPTILAGALFVLYVVVLAFAPLRDFYGLQVLSLSATIMLGLVVLGWAVTLRFIWRLYLFDRLAAFKEWSAEERSRPH